MSGDVAFIVGDHCVGEIECRQLPPEHVFPTHTPRSLKKCIMYVRYAVPVALQRSEIVLLFWNSDQSVGSAEPAE